MSSSAHNLVTSHSKSSAWPIRHKNMTSSQHHVVKSSPRKLRKQRHISQYFTHLNNPKLLSRQTTSQTLVVHPASNSSAYIRQQLYQRKVNEKQRNKHLRPLNFVNDEEPSSQSRSKTNFCTSLSPESKKPNSHQLYEEVYHKQRINRKRGQHAANEPTAAATPVSASLINMTSNKNPQQRLESPPLVMSMSLLRINEKKSPGQLFRHANVANHHSHHHQSRSNFYLPQQHKSSTWSTLSASREPLCHQGWRLGSPDDELLVNGDGLSSVKLHTPPSANHKAETAASSKYDKHQSLRSSHLPLHHRNTLESAGMATNTTNSNHLLQHHSRINANKGSQLRHHYSDPMAQAPNAFLQRVHEIAGLEVDTVRQEKNKKVRKKKS